MFSIEKKLNDKIVHFHLLSHHKFKIVTIFLTSMPFYRWMKCWMWWKLAKTSTKQNTQKTNDEKKVQDGRTSPSTKGKTINNSGLQGEHEQVKYSTPPPPSHKEHIK